ncbi:hypothetical protein D3C81_1376430 [compost metagenome]
MLAALDNPSSQGLARDIDAMPAQYFFKAVKGQAIHVLGGQQHRQNTGACHTFFNQSSRLVRSDWCRFAVAATVGFTNVFDHPDLHRHDFKLLADFLANGVFAAAADASQFVLGKLVDNFDTWQVGR